MGNHSFAEMGNKPIIASTTISPTKMNDRIKEITINNLTNVFIYHKFDKTKIRKRI
ncbi:MAG: hypothetical protein ACK5OW_01620 [bacterium]|jgi:hypothetical protein